MNGETPRVATCSWRYSNSMGQSLPWLRSAKLPWVFPRPGQPACLRSATLGSPTTCWALFTSSDLRDAQHFWEVSLQCLADLGPKWQQMGSRSWNLRTETHGITSLRVYVYVEIAARSQNGQAGGEELPHKRHLQCMYFLTGSAQSPLSTLSPIRKQNPGNAAVLYSDVIFHKSKC